MPSEIISDSLGILDSRDVEYEADFEPLALSDSITVSLEQAVVDGIGLADSASTAVFYEAIATDALGITDSRDVEYEADFDPLELTDSISVSLIAITGAQVTDVLSLSDDVDSAHTPGGENSYTAFITDELGLLDSGQIFGEAQGDPLGITDEIIVTAGVVGPERNVTDALGLLDTTAAIATYGATVVDPVGLLDSVASSSTALTTVTDVLGLLDSVSSQGTLTDSRSDALGLTDTVSSLATTQVAHTDALGLSDSVVVAVSQLSDTTDSLGLTDSVAVTGSTVLVVSDQLGLSDSALPAATRVTTVTDSLGISDSATGVASTARTQTDALGLSDAVLGVANTQAALVDAIGLRDSVAVALSTSVTDSLGLRDGFTVTLQTLVFTETHVTAVEFLGIVDTISVDHTIVGLFRTNIDLLELSDSVTRSGSVARSHTDALGLTDAISVSLGLTVVDSLGLIDEASSTADALPVVTRGLTITDQVLPAVSYERSITDDLNLGTVPTETVGLTVSDVIGLADNVVTDYTHGRVPTDNLVLSDSIAVDVVELGTWVAITSTLSVATIMQVVEVVEVDQVGETSTEVTIEQVVGIAAVAQKLEVMATDQTGSPEGISQDPGIEEVPSTVFAVELGQTFVVTHISQYIEADSVTTIQQVMELEPVSQDMKFIEAIRRES